MLVLKSIGLKVLAERELRKSARGMVDQVSQAHRVISAMPGKHAEAGLSFGGLKTAPSPLLFPAHTSMFRDLPLHTVCSVCPSTAFVHWQDLQSPVAVWCPRTVQAHNKEVVLPWPHPRAQFMAGTAEDTATKQKK